MNVSDNQCESNVAGGLGTEDTFITAVPWGTSRTVLVHRRTHGWRDYVRFRTWNKHRDKGVWYPSRRFFIIPVENAEHLADALEEAVAGVVSPKPDWLVAREQAEEEELARLVECGVTEEVFERARRELERDRRDRI